MKFVKPATGLFIITAKPEWPVIEFETDAAGAHVWQWTISWGAFTMSGTASTAANTWNASAALVNRGGTLTVKVVAGAQSASMSAVLKGTNPAPADVQSYLLTKPGGEGFDRIIQHEAKFKHFDANGVPLKSFDKGYGMCQLTNPAPTYEQVWNWKLNVDQGLALFAQKRMAASTYLSQADRSFTTDQLKYETVCRWNGGSYHRWDGTAKKWMRAPRILCDSKTGNIGWDMDDPENAGKTEAQLHARDNASYKKPPGPSAHWKYFGVCYADRVLG